jgi:hypothetical protein
MVRQLQAYDPFLDLTALPQREQQEIELEEPQDPENEFWEEAGDAVSGGYNAGYHQPFHVDVCHFDEAGEHTHIADKCPHFNAEDEEGPRIRQGWTIQQNRR